MSTETALFIFNGLFYWLQFTLWGTLLLWFVYHFYQSSTYFGIGIILICAIYSIGQVKGIFWDAKSCAATEALCLIGTAIIFFCFPKAEQLMKYSSFVFVWFLVLAMWINATYLIFPQVLEFVAGHSGTIGGYAVTGEFVRTVSLDLLFVLFCIGLGVSNHKDLKCSREADYGHNTLKKVLVSFKVVLKHG